MPVKRPLRNLMKFAGGRQSTNIDDRRSWGSAQRLVTNPKPDYTFSGVVSQKRGESDVLAYVSGTDELHGAKPMTKKKRRNPSAGKKPAPVPIPRPRPRPKTVAGD